MAVFIMLWLASFFAFNQVSERLKKKPFAHELMPWELVWLVNIGLALWLIAWDERNLTYCIGSNISGGDGGDILLLRPGQPGLSYQVRKQKGKNLGDPPAGSASLVFSPVSPWFPLYSGYI